MWKPVKTLPLEHSDHVTFRSPSNYCFICAGSISLEWPLPVTPRLAHALVMAMRLDTTDPQMTRNLVDCSLCSVCHDKLIEVNDVVRELELIEVKLTKLTNELDLAMTSGVEAQKSLVVEIHGVESFHVTPVTLRHQILQIRQNQYATSGENTAEFFEPIRITETNSPIIFSDESRLRRRLARKAKFQYKELMKSDIKKESETLRRETRNSKILNSRSEILKSSDLEATLQNPVQLPVSEDEEQYFEIDQINCAESIKIEASPRDPLCSDENEFQNFEHFEMDFSSPITNDQNTDTEIANDVCSVSKNVKIRKNKKPKLKNKGRSKARSEVKVTSKNFPCKEPDCAYRTHKMENLLLHTNKVHKGDMEPFKCPFPGCGKSFGNARYFGVHRRTHSTLGSGEGGEKGRSLSNADQSESQETEMGGAKCPKCWKVFATLQKMKTHLRMLHISPKWYHCPSAGCSAKFTGSSGLKAHQGRCHGDEFPELIQPPPPKVICDECGRAVTIRQLKTHMRLLHGPKQNQAKERRFRCTVAGCSFTTPILGKLKTHQRTHPTALFPLLTCSRAGCSQQFRSERSLFSHERTHKADFKYLSCEHCGKGGIVEQHQLMRHERLCLARLKKEHICSSCKGAFATEAYLARHNSLNPKCRPREHGPGALPCSECDKVCSNAKSLARHAQLMHSDEKPFKCSACSATFSIKEYLVRHLKISTKCPASILTTTKEPYR